MFKKLKDKIAEEVKQSPSRIQQLAQAASSLTQPGVSSASSTTSEISGSDNFFSITEEDTPHNSPLRKPGNANNVNKAQTVINGGIPASQITRVRRLSNSSMASDTSFRLPSYDNNPAVYHIQSDMEASAGEESTVASTKSIQLETISKEQLYQSYRKILDRYQKYRGRYTELAQRYRDLERDNNKARAVLVETQEKALRRLCELREQCSLEQQAKAHLEAALRLEMDELSCVNQTLKTKLTLLGENPESLDSQDKTDNLVDLSDEPSTEINDVKKMNEKTDGLEIEELKKTIETLMNKLKCAEHEVKQLKAREEENTILLAENKMMIHSELENKEVEVKKLQSSLINLESGLKKFSDDNERLQNEMKLKKSKIAELEKRVGEKYIEEDQMRELQEKIKNLELELNMSNGAIEILKDEKNKMTENLTVEKSKSIIAEEKLKALLEEKTKMLREIENERESIKQEREFFKNENEANETKKGEDSDHLKAENQELQVKNIDISKEMTILRSEYDASVQKLKNFEKIMEENEEIMKQLNLHKAENIKLQGINENLNKFQEESAKVSRDLEAVQLEKDRVVQELQDCENKRAMLEKEVADIRNELGFLSNEKELVDRKLKELEPISSKMAAENHAIKSDNDKMYMENENYKEEIRNLTQNIHGLKEEIKNISIRNANSESETIRLLEETNRAALGQINEKDTNILNLNKTIDELNQKTSEYEHNLESKQNDLVGIKNKLDNLKIEKRDLEKTLEKEIREKNELKTQVTNILAEIGRLEEQLKEVKESHAILQQEKISLEKKIADGGLKLNDKIIELENKLKSVESENSVMSDKNCLLEENNARLLIDVKDLTVKVTQLEFENKSLSALQLELDVARDAITSLEEKLRQCIDENTRMLNAKETLEHDFRSLQNQCDQLNFDAETLKVVEAENSKNCQQIGELESKNKNLQIEIDQTRSSMKTEHTNLVKQLTELQHEIEGMKSKKIQCEEENFKNVVLVEKLENENKKLVEEMKKIINKQKSDQTSLGEKISGLENQNEKLRTEISDTARTNQTRLKELENLLQITSEEKKSLKDSINKNATDLEKKIENYEELKIENQYLNTLVKQIEEEQHKGNETRRDLEKQIDNFLKEIETLRNEIGSKERIIDDLNSVIEKIRNDNSVLIREKMDGVQNTKQLEEDINKQKVEYNIQITSLQKNIDQYVESEKIFKLKLKDFEEIQKNCEKNNTNENSKNGNDFDPEVIQKEKLDLEEKLKKIMNEVQDVSNRNLFLEQKCENYLILEQNNEKLSLTNEKLLRQLDETLVSMQHHNEGISANTEFEYLKNIMFQYLTGNINKNNTTLVKVIAAVLKFSPQQTQVILEKESQRNSLLGQLNIKL